MYLTIMINDHLQAEHHKGEWHEGYIKQNVH